MSKIGRYIFEKQTIEENLNNMEFKPSGTRVVVLANPEETKTDTGIELLMPDKVYRGKVIAIGPGTDKEPMEVKVGDDVSYTKNAGTPLEIEDVKYLLMRQSAIYGIH